MYGDMTFPTVLNYDDYIEQARIMGADKYTLEYRLMAFEQMYKLGMDILKDLDSSSSSYKEFKKLFDLHLEKGECLKIAASGIDEDSPLRAVQMAVDSCARIFDIKPGIRDLTLHLEVRIDACTQYKEGLTKLIDSHPRVRNRVYLKLFESVQGELLTETALAYFKEELSIAESMQSNLQDMLAYC